MKNRRYSQSEGRPWHQVSDDTFMSLALVYLTELLLSIKFYPDSVLKNVLDVLLLCDNRTILILGLDDFLEVCWMAPCNLNCCRSLSDVGKDAHSERVLFDLRHICFKDALVQLEAILVLVPTVARSYRLPCLILAEVVLHLLCVSRQSW